MPTAELKVTAFLANVDSPDIRNPIHSTQGASEYGYKAALVGGVTVYGWTVPAIIEALGESWLDKGWVDISFRKPTYPNDEMTARVEQAAGTWSLTMSNQKGESCIAGEVGLGAAPFRDEFPVPAIRPAEPRPDTLPRLTHENAPVGQELRPMATPYTLEMAAEYAETKSRDSSPRWVGPGARVHPGWLAGQMTMFLHHSYDYGPAIHTRSQIQHLAPMLAGQTFTMCGRMAESYERKGHWYGVTDGILLSESGTEVARLRHTNIYEVAKRPA